MRSQNIWDIRVLSLGVLGSRSLGNQMKQKTFDIVIVVNSPGELSAYAKPTVKSLREIAPKGRITLVFTPCPYATGKEMEVATDFPGIAQMVNPQEFMKWIMRNKRPKRIKFGSRGVVLFLGGDLLYAGLLARKLKFNAVAYTAGRAMWQRFYDYFLVPDKNTNKKFLKKRIKKRKLKIVGDLMVDAVPYPPPSRKICAKKFGLDPKKPTISFLPGSRLFQTNYLVPFFLKVASAIKKEKPNAQLLFSLSPYMTHSILKKSFNGSNPIIKDGRGLKWKIKRKGRKDYLVATDGTSVLLSKNANHEAVLSSDITVTIPGTNTAEIGALGIPMVVVFPLDHPEGIPLEGVLEPISKIPHLGKAFKKALIKIVDKRVKFFALPNMKAGRKIVPEIRGKVKPKKVADTTLEILNNKRKLKRTKENLKKAMGARGASENLAREILKLPKLRGIK